MFCFAVQYEKNKDKLYITRGFNQPAGSSNPRVHQTRGSIQPADSSNPRVHQTRRIIKPAGSSNPRVHQTRRIIKPAGSSNPRVHPARGFHPTHEFMQPAGNHGSNPRVYPTRMQLCVSRSSIYIEYNPAFALADCSDLLVPCQAPPNPQVRKINQGPDFYQKLLMWSVYEISILMSALNLN